MSATPHRPSTDTAAETGEGSGLLATLAETLRLLRPVWPLAALATALGLASGAAAVALMARINAALVGGEGGSLIVLLAGLAVLTLATAFASEVGNTVVGQRVVAALRRSLCRQIVAAPLDRAEQVSGHRLMAVLTGDLEALSAATLSLAPVAVAAATVLGGLGYLAWQAAELFPVVAAALAIGTVVNARLRRGGMRRLEAMRDAQEDLFGNFRGIVDGGKEMRINARRRARVLDGRLLAAVDRIAGLSIRTRCIFGLADSVSAGLFFATVIVLLLVAPAGAPAATAGTILLFLYLRAPLEQLVAALPMLSRAQVALRRVAALRRALAPEVEAPAAAAPAAQTFQEIALAEARFVYPAGEAGAGFAVGPLSLNLVPGEILFITGENGAGKSTALKLLTGLYAPEQGAVRLDGAPVAAADRDRYRQLFSTVFFDYHLFDDLVLGEGVDPAQVDYWLGRLQLAGKVTVADGRLSTTRLSAGQRRRLALLQVLVEDRPVVVLDEWAAEQDPAFRRLFYTELLPELRRGGKTIVAVSHDDRFFHVADRCLELGADGRLVAWRPVPVAQCA